MLSNFTCGPEKKMLSYLLPSALVQLLFFSFPNNESRSAQRGAQPICTYCKFISEYVAQKMILDPSSM